MKYAQAATYIRQLSCMGLRGEVVMPALLEAARFLVPADFNSFFWAGDDYELCNMYSENTAMYQYAPIYFGEYYNRKEIEAIGVGFSQAMRRGHLFGNSEQFGRRFINTDMYNDLWHVVNIRHVLEVTVCENGRGWGVLKSSRDFSSRPFNHREETRLKSVATYIAHAIKAPCSDTSEMVDAGESGVIVVDFNNQIVQFSQEGRYLLQLATQTNLAASSKTDLILPLSLKRLCDNFRVVMRGQAGRPPVIFHSSPWGGFTFRAYWLNNTDGRDAGLITIVIERQIPASLKLMQSNHMLNLTAKERDVCLLLSRGLTHPEISLRMNIKTSTVIDYVRSIYVKLGVHSHKQLLLKLAGNHEELT